MGEHAQVNVSLWESGDQRVTVIDVLESKLSGPTLMQDFALELSNALEASPSKNILINLNRVEFISSAALNRLINYQKRVIDAHGRLKLCCLAPSLESVFVATRLIQVFDIRPTEREALASF
jgi:anti-sigma B factor antagonist